MNRYDNFNWEEMDHLHWAAGKGRSNPVHRSHSGAPASSLSGPWAPGQRTPVCWESQEHPGWSVSLRAWAAQTVKCQTTEQTYLILQPQIVLLVQHWGNSRELAEVCQSVSKSRDASNWTTFFSSMTVAQLLLN